MDLDVRPELLFAYARNHDGYQFPKSRLRCRIVRARTDEGYPCEGHVLELYGLPEDENWYKRATGRSEADIVFSSFRWEHERTVSAVESFLSEELRAELRNAKEVVSELEGLLKGAGL